MHVDGRSRVLERLQLPQPLGKMLAADCDRVRRAHDWRRVVQRLDEGSPSAPRRMARRLAAVCLTATLVGAASLWFTQAAPRSVTALGSGPRASASPSSAPPAPALVASVTPSLAASGELKLADGSVFDRLFVDELTTPDTRVTFEDASSITAVAANTLLEALAITEREVVLRLVHGAIDVSVTKGGARKWIVEAGELRVEVVGTRFTLSRSALRVAVSVVEGVVLVRSTRLPDGVERLTAGQHRQLTPAPAAGPRPNAEQLLRSADAARRAGDWRLAKQELERVINAFPNDPRSGVAAFQRGVVMQQMGTPPTQLIGAFEAALVKARGHSLRQDCYWRLVLALEAAGDTESARMRAEQALREYPGGRHATEFRRRVGPVLPPHTSP